MSLIQVVNGMHHSWAAIRHEVRIPFVQYFFFENVPINFCGFPFFVNELQITFLKEKCLLLFRDDCFYCKRSLLAALACTSKKKPSFSIITLFFI